MGTCYLNMGCLLATKNILGNRLKAMLYIDKSIEIQAEIMTDLREAGNHESIGNRDKVILSSRYYTQAVVLFTAFLRLE